MEVTRMITLFEGEVLGGKSFLVFLNRNFDLPSLNITNSKFLAELVKISRALLEETSSNMVSLQSFFDSSWMSIADRFISVETAIDTIGNYDLFSCTCLIALSAKLTNTDFENERKSVKLLLEAQKSTPCVTFTENETYSNPAIKECQTIITSHLSRFSSPLLSQCMDKLNFDIAVWGQKFSDLLRDSDPLLESVENDIIKGISFLYNARNFLTTSILIYPFLSQPMPRTVLTLTAALFNSISVVANVFRRHSSRISYLLHFSINGLSRTFIAENCVGPVLKSARGKGARPPAGREELYAASFILDKVMNGIVGPKEIVVSLFLSDVIAKQVSDYGELRSALAKLGTFMTLMSCVDCFSNLDFILSVREIVDPVIACLVPDKIKYLRGFLIGLQPSVDLLKQAPHLNEAQRSKLIEELKTDVKQSIVTHITKPISTIIEETVRIRVATLNSTLVGHRSMVSHDGKKKNAFSTQSIGDVLSHYSDLLVFEEDFNLKRTVERHLSELFYDLVAISLHDFKTYNQMANFAQQRFGVEITPSFLPYGTVDSGLDILNVVRHLNAFVRKFNYDLHQQYFVEKIDTAKRNVNVITIEQASNSIRSHGIGIVHSTVNFTYTFLAKKLLLVSQFLYDDHIKSRLLRANKLWTNTLQEKGTLEAQFLLKDAEVILRDARALGRTPDGVSFFDKFRELICEIGNALGFVRLLRSGSLSHTAHTVQFIPNLEEIDDFFKACDDQSNLTAVSKEAVQLLRACLENLNENFSSDSNYLGLLSQVFTSELRSDKNVHMKNFFYLHPL
ncbi:hypothetical protein GEMRC1_009375 [Eukaryota sp. GEM-RC1]